MRNVDEGGFVSAEEIRCLVTGATGYIGGQLVPRLLDDGLRVRAMARNPDKLADVHRGAMTWRWFAAI